MFYPGNPKVLGTFRSATIPLCQKLRGTRLAPWTHQPGSKLVPKRTKYQGHGQAMGRGRKRPIGNVAEQTMARVTDFATPARFALECMRVVKLHTATGFVNRAFHIFGGQWVGQAPPRPTPTHLLAARANDLENGAHDRGAPLVDQPVLTKPTYLREPT